MPVLEIGFHGHKISLSTPNSRFSFQETRLSAILPLQKAHLKNIQSSISYGMLLALLEFTFSDIISKSLGQPKAFQSNC